MKGTFLIAVVVIFSVLVIPLGKLNQTKEEHKMVAAIKSDVVYDKDNKTESLEKIKVLKDDKVVEYSVNDYIFGVVAAEMPALYEKEALKAQAVAAYTFLLYKKETSQTNDYHISADPQTAQCFISREEARIRWGEKAQEYEDKINECIKSVEGEMLTFEKKPIFAAYHAISAGKTNNCADVWNTDLPYLKSVDSQGDCLANGYQSEVSFTSAEIGEKLKDIAKPDVDTKEYFTNIKTNDSGYVKGLEYCGKEISGVDIAKVLGLRSCNFEINITDDGFTFLVKGYGHGVGMSQTGADYMAKQGYNYKEILNHYYSGTILQKNKILLDK